VRLPFIKIDGVTVTVIQVIIHIESGAETDSMKLY
jgi:hypothetical protein